MAHVTIYCLNLDSDGQSALVQVNHSGKHIHWPVCRSIILSRQLLLSLPITIPKCTHMRQSTMSDPTGNDTRRWSYKRISSISLFITSSNVSEKATAKSETVSSYLQQCIQVLFVISCERLSIKQSNILTVSTEETCSLVTMFI
jgi:hypothetical protein